MKNTIFIKEASVLLLLYLFSCLACAQQKTISNNDINNVEAIAFPGAEGFGKFAIGGRGGKVYIITNLNDEGEGRLRQALNRSGARIIVFAVSGTIHLKSPLNIKANTTIAGQTAPGDGICIADHPVKLDGDNIIIRYMRFRMGDRHQNQGKVAGAGHDDALSANNQKNLIIDHCSLSWSTDEVFSAYNGDSVTIQWNIISEPLNYSYHFEKGDTDFQRHGFGGIWGGKKMSAHHNLFAHCLSRTPRFNGIRHQGEEFVDYRNNVIYNWGNNNVYGGEGGTYNIINNYYKFGPATGKNVQHRIVNPSKTDAIPFGKYYIGGNFVDGAEAVTSNNLNGVHMGQGGTEEDKKAAIVNKPFLFSPVTSQTAADAYHLVLQKAGASFRRDTLDHRIINDVKNRTGRIIDVQGGFPHGTPYTQSASAWPILKSTTPPVDGDKDGMPDEWERKNRLNPNDASDASQINLHKFYTNIEVYINSLIP
jgi:pectate lyase